MKLRLQIFILFISVTIRSLSAQDVKASSQIDKDHYLIGDYIRLQIQVTTDSTNQLFWPQAEGISSFDIISVNPIDTIRQQSSYILNQEIVYSIYDSGKYAMPVIQFQYKKAGGQQMNSVFTDSINFTVGTLPVDTTSAIKPIKGNLDVKVKNYLWLYILIGVIVLGIIGFGLYLTFFSKKSIKNILPKTKPKPLHERTLEKLKLLDEKKLWQRDEIKEYFIELTDILRDYMEQRYAVKAMESTSDEIISQLTHLQTDPDLISKIAFILEVADMAKFAKSKPLPNENTLAMNYAINYVEATKPVETPNTPK